MSSVARTIPALTITTEKQRLRSDGCSSADFYFTPPEGNFDITVKVRDASNNELESHTLQFKARTTNSLKLKAISVCDAKDGASPPRRSRPPDSSRGGSPAG